MIRVFVYDDNIERRESLKQLLTFSTNMIFVGEAENCSHVIEDMQATHPHVVLMDINMPEVDGIEGLKLIKSKHPEVQILMQTAFDDSDKVFTSIRFGASGYILKREGVQRITQAIEEVYQGGAVMNPAIAKKVLDYFRPSEVVNPLTPKEMEVLESLAEGLSYKMVADKLKITYGTVNTYTKRIYDKLHISSLGEAIAWYYKHIK